MDKYIHSIEMFICLLTPRHTAYKTKRYLACIYNRQRKKIMQEEQLPHGGFIYLFGLLNAEIEVAGFAQKCKTGRFNILHRFLNRRLIPRCRSPPSIFVSPKGKMKMGGNNVVFYYTHDSIKYCLKANWTNTNGESTIFQEIVISLSNRGQPDLKDCLQMAVLMDLLVDKLYDLFYIFTDEYKNTPYNPRFRRMLISAFSELEKSVEVFAPTAPTDEQQLLADLFRQVLDTLQETTETFLNDNAYQSKYRERMRDKEQLIETTDQSLLSCEFESVLIQMIDLSQMMSCLTDLQRQRLVKHVFLKYTFQEIALQEGVNDAVIYRSVTAALKKLRQQLT